MSETMLHPACPHAPALWRLGDCTCCGSEVRYCPWCPFFPCAACARVLPRPMPCEETYPYFPVGHLSAEQCRVIWLSYIETHLEDLTVATRLPLATQQRLSPYGWRNVLIFLRRFGFTRTHLGDLCAYLSPLVAELKAGQDA